MTETGAESGLGPDASGRTGPPVGGVGQEADNGTPVPPYEGRTTAAATEDSDEPEERKQRFEGVPGGTKGSRTEELTNPDSTPGGRTTSPADEQPAAEQTQTRDSDPGVGPAHMPGTLRGEDVIEKEGEAGRERTGTKGASDRPVGQSTDQDDTSINSQSSDGDSPRLPTGSGG